MAKKTAVATTEEYPSGTSVPWSPGVSRVMTSVFESPGAKRKALLEALGERKPRKKYKSTKIRKTAATKRRKERKKKKTGIFEQFGILPRTRGPKMTETQKKEKRSVRGKTRRSLFRDMARANPELAMKHGIDVNKFKL